MIKKNIFFAERFCEKIGVFLLKAKPNYAKLGS
jgi:hypothetical protein